ncbi:DUF1302 domain-containing protein [Zavarzinia compransoris]|nr:DUF1302 family protein [Zavarzinia compransoris]TDP47238.1 uncharacterized protein DUF1302 [Zavarzinia compransoris]
MNDGKRGRRSSRRLGLMAASAVALAAATASAYNFDLSDEISGSIIVSLSTGAQVRMADRDPRNYGYYYGGGLISAGNDNGNFNFDKYDVFSQITNVRTELSLKWQNYLFYVRGNAFYDSIASNNDLADFAADDRVYTSGRYTPSAKKKAEWGAQLLDYYIRGDYTLADRPLTVTVGSQILNWGEALFTINGISVINPIDVARIRVPGAELKDALIPVPMVSASYGITDQFSVEAFYQLDFEPFKLDTCGSFFSFTDNFCNGAKFTETFTDGLDRRTYTAGTGLNPTDYDNPQRQMLAANLPIHQDDDPDVNDWGVSLRYFSPELNNTEFQLYYMNYTSRLPSFRYTSPPQFANGTGNVNLGAAPVPLVQGLLDQLGVDQLNALTSALSTIVGGPVNDLLGALTNPLSGALIDPPFGTSPRSKVLENIENGRLEIYYPTGLQMIGFALNTTYDPFRLAINAEISWKHNVPIWISEPAFLATAYNANGGVPIDQVTRDAETPICVGTVCVPNFGVAATVDAPGVAFDDRYIPGRQFYLDESHDAWQAAIRFTQIYGGTDFITRLLGCNQLIGLVEFGAMYFDLDDGTQYAAYGQNGFSGFSTRPLNVGPLEVVPSLPATVLGPGFPATGKTPSKWSGGVQGLFFWDYPNVFDGVTLTPSVGFSHGLFGITPAPNPGFVKSVTSMNFGLKAEYGEHWAMNVNYFKSWGGGGGSGGSRNPYLDRDFIGFNVSYIF